MLTATIIAACRYPTDQVFHALIDRGRAPLDLQTIKQSWDIGVQNIASEQSQAAYDLKKLHGKHILRRIGHTRCYEPLPSGLRAMTALVVLRNKAIKPSLLPLNLSAQPAVHTTQNRSTATTTP
jgi:hypothetical protein